MKLRSGATTGLGDGTERDGQKSKNLNRSITIFGRSFNYILLLTHFNIFLYAACFFIQVGTLPVSIVKHIESLKK